MTDEACITALDPTDTRPSGHRVTKSVTDLRGERRTITRTVRGEDSLERAIEIRDEIEAKKDSAQWLRRTFSEPKSERRKKNLLGQLGVEDPDVIYQPKEETQDPAEKLKSMTVRGWVEAGVHEDPDHPDAISGFAPTEDPNFRGWLREAFDRYAHTTIKMKVTGWKHLRRWGVLNDRSPADATMEHLRSFRSFLEETPSLNAKSSIQTYLKKLREIVNEWSLRAGVQKPLRQTLDSSRIRGEDATSKVVDPDILLRLRDGFRQAYESDHASSWPRRIMCWHLLHVHLSTGMRSGELLGLRTNDIDRETQTVHVQRSITPTREIGPIKEVKISGDQSRTKRIPLLSTALSAIDDWMTAREDHGWPSESEQDLIFCRRDGSPWTPRGLWEHYRRASERAGIGETISPHRIRHSLNDLLRQHEVGIDVRRAILGHASDDINRGYTDPRGSEALDGLEKAAETLQLKSS